MTETSLNPVQAWNAMYIFLQNIWNTEEKKFESRGIGLGAYLCFINGPFDKDYEWRRVYFKTQEKDFIFDDKILPQQLFTIMVKVVLKYQTKYGFDLESLLSLFKSMKEDPSLHQLEWKLWHDVLKNALIGQKKDWFNYTYYGNW